MQSTLKSPPRSVHAMKSPPLLPKKRSPGPSPQENTPALKAAAAGAGSSPSTQLEQRYERLEQLGHGSYGTVWLVKRKADQQLLAMKSVPLPPLASKTEAAVAERKRALREVDSLQQLQSVHVVRYADMILAPPTAERPQSELHIFTEYCEAGDLAQYLAERGSGGLTEPEVWSFALPVLFGLRDLHSHGILHRDLKPANILLKRCPTIAAPDNDKKADHRLRPLLGDLGLARSVSESQPLASTLVGTPHYCAPEIFEGVPYAEKADVYSFGVCVYELMHGQTPHHDVQNIVGLVRRVLRLDLGASGGLAGTAKFDARFSAELRSFVSSCLQVSPDARPSAEELLRRAPDHYRGLPDAGSPTEGVKIQADGQIDVKTSKCGESAKVMESLEMTHRPLRSPEPDQCAEAEKDKESANKENTLRPPASDSGDSAAAPEVPSSDRKENVVDVLRAVLLPPEQAAEGKATATVSRPQELAASTDLAASVVRQQPAHQYEVQYRLAVAPPAAAAATATAATAAGYSTNSSGGLLDEAPSLLVEGSSVQTGDGRCSQSSRVAKDEKKKRPVWGQAVVGLGMKPMSYVSRAQECWSRWRRERQVAAKGAKAAPGCKPFSKGSTGGTKFSDTTASIEGLEIRGVAPPRTPKPSRMAGARV